MKIFILAILTSINICSFAQDTNKVVFDEESEDSIFVGYITWEVLEDSAFAQWFNSEYESYEPELELIDYMAEKLNLLNITVVMGTWCSDSRREIPRLLKILDYADFPENQLTVIGVDRSKIFIPSGGDTSWEVELVPTIIFSLGEKEIGRIVENPLETLEQDIEQIITGQEF